MNTKSIVVLAVVVVLIIAAVALFNRNDSPRNDLSQSFDRTADNIEEGVNDGKREVKDALD